MVIFLIKEGREGGSINSMTYRAVCDDDILNHVPTCRCQCRGAPRHAHGGLHACVEAFWGGAARESLGCPPYFSLASASRSTRLFDRVAAVLPCLPLAFIASPVDAGLPVGGRGYPRDGESGVGGHGKPQ